MAARNHDRTDPTGVVVKRLAAAGQANASTAQAQRGEYQGWKVWVGAADLTSTGTGNPAFINPESGPVWAKVSYIVSVTAGTGTIDIGTGSDGTGANAAFIDGGTLTVGAHTRYTDHGTVAASATKGVLDLGFLSIAGNGTSGDSVIMQSIDTPTSTMGGLNLVVEYIDVITG